MTLDYEELKQESEAVQDTEYEEYYQKLRSMQRKMTSTGYQVEQLKIQIQYLESVSGKKKKQ